MCKPKMNKGVKKLTKRKNIFVTEFFCGNEEICWKTLFNF